MLNTFQLSQEWLSQLIEMSRNSPRLRQHCNIHHSHDDPCQCLFNAVGVDSYIRPHRHSLDPKNECLVAIKGLFALIKFSDDGNIEHIDLFGTELYQRYRQVNIGVLLSPDIWHTVVALLPDSVLMEIKPGPYSINTAKEFAKWAPEEGSTESVSYLSELREKVLSPIP